MVNFHIVIPARYSSTRFPGKPLALINGKPMIQHVYEIGCQAGAQSVIIATDSLGISDACRKFTDKVLISPHIYNSGTERIAHVCEYMKWDDDEIVVNLQGDEPVMPPSLLTQVAEELAYYGGIDCEIATLFTYSKDFNNPNDVKVVSDEYGIALYFSRHDIPYGSKKLKRHIGVYAYRVGFLKNYLKMNECGMERAEHLEQLRAIYHGAKIRVEEALEVPGPDVNVPSDIKRVEEVLNVEKL